MAKPELGTKRIDPETGRKFYDLNKDPIVSPYTGASYPRSYFESGSPIVIEEEEEVEQKELDAEEQPEIVTLEEADEETKGPEEVPDDVDDEVEVELADDDEDTFLEAEEEEDDDVSDIIGVGEDEDEV